MRSLEEAVRLVNPFAGGDYPSVYVGHDHAWASDGVVIVRCRCDLLVAPRDGDRPPDEFTSAIDWSAFDSLHGWIPLGSSGSGEWRMHYERNRSDMPAISVHLKMGRSVTAWFNSYWIWKFMMEFGDEVIRFDVRSSAMGATRMYIACRDDVQAVLAPLKDNLPCQHQIWGAGSR